MTSPPKTKKPTRARQKRMIQSDYVPRQIAWTREEVIALAKGWVAVSVTLPKYQSIMATEGV
ncbi:hypothetical protein Tco_0426662, partial [Tanacetum coccineum]